MALLKFSSAFKDYLWGGNKLKNEYHKKYNGEILAESWELSCHPDGPCIITNGIYKGKSFKNYIEIEGKQVLGTNCNQFLDFPILIKFIDAKDNLSIQVHPSDEYALSHENQYGKTEMWYVADCEKDAFLYYGFSKEISNEDLKKRIQNATLTEVLNKVYVKKGDVFFIDAGTLHAIGKGIVIAEIQQNSNITYRVFDYERVDINGKKRELDIEKALQVTNLESKSKHISFEPHLGTCKYFTVDKVVLDNKYIKKFLGEVKEDSFLHILVLEGEGTIEYEDGGAFQKGDSMLLTASSGNFEVSGECELLFTYVSNKLRRKGYV